MHRIDSSPWLSCLTISQRQGPVQCLCIMSEIRFLSLRLTKQKTVYKPDIIACSKSGVTNHYSWPRTAPDSADDHEVRVYDSDLCRALLIQLETTTMQAECASQHSWSSAHSTRRDHNTCWPTAGWPLICSAAQPSSAYPRISCFSPPPCPSPTHQALLTMKKPFQNSHALRLSS